MEIFASPEMLMALVTLTAMEIVLGIDNIIFISILAGKLPAEQQRKARLVGLGAAMATRIGLLFSLSWIMGLTEPLLTVASHGISGRDAILILGGLFLLYKSSTEIHEKVEGKASEAHGGRAAVSFAATIVQIMMLDIVFSLDSVITAVGMINNLTVMVSAIVASVGVMMFASGGISDFVNRHKSVKLLALSFLLLIGVLLVAEGFGQHIEKGYVYFAMAFSFGVEMLNLRMKKNSAE